jgi:hypothetical protein
MGVQFDERELPFFLQNRDSVPSGAALHAWVEAMHSACASSSGSQFQYQTTDDAVQAHSPSMVFLPILRVCLGELHSTLLHSTSKLHSTLRALE